MNLPEEKPIPASEIIAEQKKEIEQLKKKLSETETSRDLFYEQRTVLMLQADIASIAAQIDDIKLLRMSLGMLKGYANQQIEMEQEGEKNGL